MSSSQPVTQMNVRRENIIGHSADCASGNTLCCPKYLQCDSTADCRIASQLHMHYTIRMLNEHLPETDLLHDGETITIPQTYRELRIALMKLTAANGYAAERYRLFQSHSPVLAALGEREQLLMQATEDRTKLGDPLSDEHRRIVVEVFELMQVPGHPSTGLRENASFVH